MIGKTLGHYTIESRLGAGGMGEVFLCRDTALGRPAALKILPPNFDAQLRARLLREAETNARLQHPAIATFYDAGELNGTAYIALEYVRGTTLRERLQRGGLETAEALGITACVLEALSHAHATGILHRDIKPENVMVTGPRAAKLLDFGLAIPIGRALRDEVSSALTPTVLTLPGLVVGTPGYMSPEQLRGRPLDARSDVFAVGALLYEALSGQPAFPGPAIHDRIAAVLASDPPPLAGLPAAVAAMLARSLDRDPDRRYPSAAAFLADLYGSEEGRAVTTLPDSVAVVDFANLSGAAEDAWIGTGIAESVGAVLQRAPGVQVVPREKLLRARASAGSDADAIEVAQGLGCRWALAGSYQRQGPRLRVTVRLNEVPTGRVAVSENVDGALDTIFEIQDRVTLLDLARAASRLPGRHSEARDLLIRARSTGSREAETIEL